MREIVEIPLTGTNGSSGMSGHARAVATVHRPALSPRSTTVILLNAGHVPRNGHGGLPVNIADTLCEQGWPVVRVDLPGLGDSPGSLPERIEAFWLDLKNGAHASLAAGVSDWAKDALGKENIALGGVCGAAVTAVFTAHRYPGKVQSLLLIEPELFESEPAAEAEQPFAGSSGAAEALSAAEAFACDCKVTARLGPSWRLMRLLSRRRGKYRWLGRLQGMILRMVSTPGEIPARANLALVEAWAEVAGRGVPSLVMTAEGLLWEAYFRQSRHAVFRGREDGVLHIAVPGANHVFSNAAAKAAVLETVPAWLEGIQPEHQ